MGAIRGAICAENTVEDISSRAVELVETILQRNDLSVDDVQAVIFTATADLNACYPATAVRRALNADNTAFLCVQEMSVDGALNNCLRVCVLTDARSQNECKHVYLGKAALLRSDVC